jgi:hypothetical protein
MSLDPTRIPDEIVSLIPIAEKWGIGDDFEREAALREASRSELEALAHSTDSIDEDDLYKWLAGPESFDPSPSDEYIAFSNLSMAIDSARLKLSRLIYPTK